MLKSGVGLERMNDLMITDNLMDWGLTVVGKTENIKIMYILFTVMIL